MDERMRKEYRNAVFNTMIDLKENGESMSKNNIVKICLSYGITPKWFHSKKYLIKTLVRINKTELQETKMKNQLPEIKISKSEKQLLKESFIVLEKKFNKMKKQWRCNKTDVLKIYFQRSK